MGRYVGVPRGRAQTAFLVGLVLLFYLPFVYLCAAVLLSVFVRGHGWQVALLGIRLLSRIPFEHHFVEAL